MCNLKITSPLCLLPTGAGSLKSLSPKRECQRTGEDQTKEGGITVENGAQVGGQRQNKSKKGKEGRERGKMWDRCIFETESDNEFMKLSSSLSGPDSYVVNCSLSTTPVSH